MFGVFCNFSNFLPWDSVSYWTKTYLPARLQDQLGLRIFISLSSNDGCSYASMVRIFHRCWGLELRSSYFQNKCLPNPQSEAISSTCVLVYLKIKCQKTAEALDLWFYPLVSPINTTVVEAFPPYSCQNIRFVLAYNFLTDYIVIIWLLFISISAHSEVV